LTKVFIPYTNHLLYIPLHRLLYILTAKG